MIVNLNKNIMTKIFFIFISIIFNINIICVYGQDNNVCGTFKDYYTIKSNDRCWYDVAASGTIHDVIISSGYPIEDHKVMTSDGYILTIFRIPNTEHPSPKPNPVYLQHGLIADSSAFIGINNKSLAFILSDAGYDVWLGNYRGTTQSEGHILLKPKDKRYWDHGLDELGLIDIPTMIDYIRGNTGRREKLFYVGHSLGTTIGMIYSSALPKEAEENIKLFMMLAPAHKLTHMVSPFRKAAPFSETILEFINQYDLERFVSQGIQQRALVKMICTENPKVMQLCAQLFNQFYGPRTQIGTEVLPVIFNFLPAGTSIKVLKHISDFIGDKFQKYDYGTKNIEKYGQSNPPEYNVNDIRVPVYVMYSLQDWATTKEDATNFYYSLAKKSRFGLYEIKIDAFNHMDFLYGRSAKRLVYDQILNVFNRIENKP